MDIPPAQQDEYKYDDGHSGLDVSIPPQQKSRPDSKPLAQYAWFMPLLFFVVRMMMIIAFPLEGLYGFGDIKHFYQLAKIGWPYLDYWVEFPPVFPFLSTLLFKLAGTREHIYVYLLVLSLSIAQAATIFVFIKLSQLTYPEAATQWRIYVFTVIMIGLAYGWWYFDPLAVLFTLLGIYYLLNKCDTCSGFSLAAGALIKLFPLLVIPAAWRYRSKHQAAILTAIALGSTLLVYLGLYLVSPENTAASLASQASKGSWETIWALIDGNFNTGNFGPLIERFNPQFALTMQGNPPRLPPILTLVPFLAIGAWIYKNARRDGPIAVIAFIGLTWCIFLLWSPGWSPQWVLYLIPLTLLTLPDREASLLTVILVLINLLEWPVMLSRGYQWGLLVTIPLRTLIMILLIWLWYQQVSDRNLIRAKGIIPMRVSD